MKWIRHNYQICKPLGTDGRPVSGSAGHIELSRRAAAEGIVLLKNERQALPLKKGKKVVLLGKASEEYVKGGGGSGDVTVAYVHNLYEGMKCKEAEGKVQVYDGLHDFYEQNIKMQYEAGREPGMTKEPVLSEEQLQKASAFSDTAVLSICRFSGEGWDRRCEQESEAVFSECESWEGENELRRTGKEIFQRGDFYLSFEEEKLFMTACEYFPHLIVVINAGGVVDSEWFVHETRVDAVLFAGQGGMEGGFACADILCADMVPSGKLVDTFAKKLEDYPSTEGFHDSASWVEYTEDIYVGYRYFETIPGMKKRVNYPFGFGLSYTSFAIDIEETILQKECLRCRVSVKNTGHYPGKEVVQLYFSAPQGKLGKPARQLIGFEKTELLLPGEIASVLLEVDTTQLASYDDCGKICKSAWLLEKGRYSFYVGTSVRDTQELNVYLDLAEDKIIAQLSEKLHPEKLTRRMLSDGNYEQLQCGEYEEVVRPPIFDSPQELEGIAPEVRFEERVTLQEHFHPEKKTIHRRSRRKIKSGRIYR